MTKETIGWLEWVELQELGLPKIKVKIDTGARTSAIHAKNIKIKKKNKRCSISQIKATKDLQQGKCFANEEWYACFDLFPLQRNNTIKVSCCAPIIDIRPITDTGGRKEERIIIQTTINIGGIDHSIEFSLTDRDSMRYRVLLGRSFVAGKYVIDPEQSFLFGIVSSKKLKKLYKP